MSSTQNVILDTSQYVKINDDPGSFLLQSHGDTVRIAFSDVKPTKSNTAFHELGGQASIPQMFQTPYYETFIWALAMTDSSSLTITRSNMDVPVAIKEPLNPTGNVSISNFLIEVAKGNIPGHSVVNKFGHNPLTLATGADVWAGLGTYGFYPTLAQTMELVSTSAADDANPAGTGAWTVLVFGLDENYLQVSETVSTDGLVPVVLENTYIRMSSAIIMTAGSAESNVGAISIRIAGAGTVGAFIGINDGQTQQAIYTIPASKTGFFLKGYVGMMEANKNGEDATFNWKMRPINGGNGAWQIKGRVGLVNIGTSTWQYEYGAPAGPIPEKTDIRIEVEVASTTVDSVGGFDLLLVDDGY